MISMESMKFEIRSESPEETRKAGFLFGERLPAGTLITLNGELGAGKTTFTQGIARGLGITGKVTSPTFVLMKKYTEGRVPLYHIDAYRMEDVDQDLGFSEYLDDDGICVIEWSGFLNDSFPEERIDIEINTDDEDNRTLTVTAFGKYVEVVRDICTQLE